jgi:hypothetical protein
MVTGWMNAFHHWDASGGLLSRSQGVDVLSIDSVGYLSRSISDMPRAYTNTPSGTRANLNGYIYSLLGDLTAGMIGEKMTCGVRETHAPAMQKAGLSTSLRCLQ